MKRFILLLLAVLVICSCAAAEQTALVCGDYTYSVNEDGSACLQACSSTDTELTLPAEVDGLPVTVIGESFLAGNEAVTAVTVPEGLKIIDVNAFSGCTALTDVVLPNTLRTIRAGAFAGCSVLPKVRIPNSVTTIGAGSFMDCPKLRLHVTSGTMAEMYAEDNEIPFVGYD